MGQVKPISQLTQSAIVFLDSMLFIYLLDTTNPDYYPLAQRLFKYLETQKVTNLTSVISLLETLSSPSYINQPNKINEYSRFFQEMEGLTVHPVSWEICLEAASLRRQNRSLKTPDSIQLATAIVNKTSVFITNDDRLNNIASLPFPIIPLRQISL